MEICAAHLFYISKWIVDYRKRDRNTEFVFLGYSFEEVAIEASKQPQTFIEWATFPHFIRMKI